MNTVREAIYVGKVVHTRLRPRRHKLRYSVFSCLFDCSRLEALADRSAFFSFNRFNLFSLHDRDHFDGGGIGKNLDRIAARHGYSGRIGRFMMLCYPRLLGYAFNPLTVYFGLDAAGTVCLTVYEVRNTFGERHIYTLPAKPDSRGLIAQACDKEFYVSPFNAVEGRYLFRVTTPSEKIAVGVALTTDEGPLMTAHFTGARAPLTDRHLLSATLRTGWMTVKVIAGIHYEAAKLWLKGLRLVPRPRARAKAKPDAARPIRHPAAKG